MKRYIKSDTQIELMGTLDIIIEFEYALSKLAASSILPVTDELGNLLSDQAYADWKDFILNIESEIINLDFEIYKTDFGDNEVSHYYYLRAKDINDNLITNKMFKVRVSNHKPTKANVLHNRNEIQYYKSNMDIKLKFKDVIVNGDKYNSYDEAEYEVINQLRNIKNKLIG